MVTSLELSQMVSDPFGAATDELEAELIRRCCQRDAVAWRRFVTRFHRMIFAYVGRALGPQAPVDDLAQEVFLRASKALGRFDVHGPAKLSTWLLTIAAHVVADARKRFKLSLAEPEQVLRLADSRTPESEMQRGEIRTALARAASQLSDDQRDVFILAEFHELSMAEIGQVLGVPENTVKQRLFRARERLRELLTQLRED